MSRHLPTLRQTVKQMQLELLTRMDLAPETTPEQHDRIRHMKARVRLGDEAYLRWLLREQRKTG